MSTLNNENTQSQCANILQHLQNGKSINPLQALNQFECFRLGARIYDLKQDGYLIDSWIVRTENVKNYAENFLRVNNERS